MSQFYELVTPGAVPLTTAEAKAHMRVTTEADDKLILGMINSVTEYAENSGRDLRANSWKLKIDKFEDPICLRKSPVESITLVQYTLAGTLTTIANTVYYLVQSHQFSEVRLLNEQEWPTDGDDVETTNLQTIEITFATEVPRLIASAKSAMLMHVANFYQNRGDCTLEDAAKDSGAQKIYDNLLRIERI